MRDADSRISIAVKFVDLRKVPGYVRRKFLMRQEERDSHYVSKDLMEGCGKKCGELHRKARSQINLRLQLVDQ